MVYWMESEERYNGGDPNLNYTIHKYKNTVYLMESERMCMEEGIQIRQIVLKSNFGFNLQNLRI